MLTVNSGNKGKEDDDKMFPHFSCNYLLILQGWQTARGGTIILLFQIIKLYELGFLTKNILLH